MKSFSEILYEGSEKLTDFSLARSKDNVVHGYAAIGFRFSNKPNSDFIKNDPFVLGGGRDNWFRKTEGVAKGFGLMIRDYQITSKSPFEMGQYRAYKAKIKYLPNREDNDDGTNYEVDNFWVLVHEKFELKDVLDFIDRNKKSYYP